MRKKRAPLGARLFFLSFRGIWWQWWLELAGLELEGQAPNPSQNIGKKFCEILRSVVKYSIMKSTLGFTRAIRAVVPAFLLAVSVGQIYAFTVFSDPIAQHLAAANDDPVALRAKVQFAFSLGIFFLGMGAAFFGKIVERSIRLSTLIGTALFLSGLIVTSIGVRMKSLPLIYLGYGFLLGTGTGIIYISPVKTMMLWFPNAKAIAAAVPIISFGLGSSLCTLLYEGFGFSSRLLTMRFEGFHIFSIEKVFIALAIFYAVPMLVSSFILRKPKTEQMTFAHDMPGLEFSYLRLSRNTYFLRVWLFMFLNISCGLCLIPLAKQLMATVGTYSDGFVTLVLTLMGLMNGAGRFLFAWWSDRLARRVNILLIILAISAGVMLTSYVPVLLAIALIVIPACYGAGFSVLPAVLADHYGMTNISKIHGAALSAWGVAGLVGNQVALPVFKRWGLAGVATLLVIGYLINAINVYTLTRARPSAATAA